MPDLFKPYPENIKDFVLPTELERMPSEWRIGPEITLTREHMQKLVDLFSKICADYSQLGADTLSTFQLAAGSRLKMLIQNDEFEIPILSDKSELLDYCYKVTSTLPELVALERFANYCMLFPDDRLRVIENLQIMNHLNRIVHNLHKLKEEFIDASSSKPADYERHLARLILAFYWLNCLGLVEDLLDDQRHTYYRNLDYEADDLLGPHNATVLFNLVFQRLLYPEDAQFKLRSPELLQFQRDCLRELESSDQLTQGMIWHLANIKLLYARSIEITDEAVVIESYGQSDTIPTSVRPNIPLISKY